MFLMKIMRSNNFFTCKGFLALLNLARSIQVLLEKLLRATTLDKHQFTVSQHTHQPGNDLSNLLYIQCNTVYADYATTFKSECKKN